MNDDFIIFEGLATNHSKRHQPQIGGSIEEVLEYRSSRETDLLEYHYIASGDFERGTILVFSWSEFLNPIYLTTKCTARMICVCSHLLLSRNIGFWENLHFGFSIYLNH